MMEKVDVLIIGNGICGSSLAFQLLKSGKKVLVIDNEEKFSSSRVASGVINPVTGRRAVTTWLSDILMPFCWEFYSLAEKDLQIKCIEQTNLLSFHVNQQREDTYDKRLNENHPHLKPFTNESYLKEFFNFEFGVTEIHPVYWIDVQAFLNAVKLHLLKNNSYLNETFNEDELIVNTETIQYKNIQANKIIYCNGITSLTSVYWNKLPFVKNKGQALLIEVPALPKSKIYKFGSLTIVPWKENIWWVGSTYELHFFTENPTIDFYMNTQKQLNNIFKTSYTIKDHIASIRPAVVERRPFVGFHPTYKNVGILNGMGTKGCSLAPYFASQLSNNIISNASIIPEANISRFQNLLIK